MRRVLLGSLVLISALLAGCSSSSKFVGSWDLQQGGTTVSADLYPDGRLAIVSDLPNGGGTKVKLSGNWRQEGDSLVVAMKQAEFENMPKQAAAYAKDFQDAFQKQVADHKEEKSSVKWDGDDRFTATDTQGRTAMFTRRK